MREKKTFFLVNQTLELNRFYYTESSNLRPVRSHSDASKMSPQDPTRRFSENIFSLEISIGSVC